MHAKRAGYILTTRRFQKKKTLKSKDADKRRKTDEVTTYPEITKKISTPIKPFGSHLGAR